MKGYVRFLEKKCLILFLSKNIPLQETLLFVACFVCGEWCDKLDENIFFWGGGRGKLWLYSRFNNRFNLISITDK